MVGFRGNWFLSAMYLSSNPSLACFPEKGIPFKMLYSAKVHDEDKIIT